MRAESSILTAPSSPFSGLLVRTCLRAFRRPGACRRFARVWCLLGRSPSRLGSSRGRKPCARSCPARDTEEPRVSRAARPVTLTLGFEPGKDPGIESLILPCSGILEEGRKVGKKEEREGGKTLIRSQQAALSSLRRRQVTGKHAPGSRVPRAVPQAKDGGGRGGIYQV